MSIPGEAIWAGLSGAFTTLTGKFGTNLGGQVLGEDVDGLGVVSGEEEHVHISDWVLLCRVGGTDAVGFFWRCMAAALAPLSGVEGLRLTSQH